MHEPGFASFLVLAVGAALAPWSHAQSLVERLPRDEWLILSMGGADAGFTHRVRDFVTVDGVRLVRTHETSGMRMARLGSTIEVKGETTSLELPDGGPVRFESVTDYSARETRSVVDFKDGKAFSSTTTAGRTQKDEKAMPAGLVGAFGLERLIVDQLGRAGAEIEATFWFGDTGQPTDVYAKIIGPEDVELAPGKTERLTRVELELESMGMKSTTWYDAEGREVRTRMLLAGIEIQTRRATEAEMRAVQGNKDVVSADVFAPSMVKEPYFLPEPRRAERAVVRLRAREAGTAVGVLEDDRQRVLETDADGSVLVELRVVTPPPGATAARPLAPSGELNDELRECLVPNTAIQSDAPLLVELAKEVVGSEADAWRAAQLIERWVEKNVTDKNFDVGFASALEVAEDRAGDCSEHAVLLAALCRASGIPCRVVMGLLYIGGIWGGHAWNEVWIDGRWYALDGTLGLGHADALHLAMSKMTLGDGVAGNEFAPLLSGLGRLDAEVLELSITRTIEPKESCGRIEDGHYVDRAFGVAFALPDGAEAEVLRPEQGLGFELLKVRAPKSDAPQWRLALRAYDLGVDGAWPSFLPLPGGVAIEVDGRPALRFESPSDTAATLRFLVRSGGSAFEFKFSNVAAASRAAVDELVESIDFDR